MKAQVSVQVKGFTALARKLETAEEMAAFRAEILEPAMRVAKDTTKQHAPRFTGALAGSLTTEIEPFSARLYTPLKTYPMVMEGGRKPGGPVPPSAALEQWAQRHGIQNIFMLAAAIARRGVKGRFFRRKGRTAVRKELPALMGNMAHAMEKDWGREVPDA